MMPEGLFTLTSTAFEEGGSIPRRHSCDGDDVSPELQWSGAPDGTGALVLLMDDPDARGFVHWLVVDISATASGGLPEGFSSSPDAPRQGTNSFGSVGYRGPCPPSGTHRYVFTLFAVSAPLNVPGEPDVEAVRSAMEGRILDQATLTGTYTRGG
jgi:Raf kinase inhibitor-like YbhB/YbcL family protein